MPRPRATAALLVACLAVAGCGDEEQQPTETAACGVPQGDVVTGPFCLTGPGARESLAAAGVDVSCSPARGQRRRSDLLIPKSIERCRTDAGTRFTLVVYASPQEALRARGGLLERHGVERISSRFTVEHNLVVVLDRDDRRGRRLLGVVEELGDDVT